MRTEVLESATNHWKVGARDLTEVESKNAQRTLSDIFQGYKFYTRAQKPLLFAETYDRCPDNSSRGHSVTVDGYANPFSNPGHPCDGWLNRDLPIEQGITLHELFKLRQFHIVVLSDPLDAKECFGRQLPKAFSYPYGNNHSWQPNTYKHASYGIKRSLPFARALNFEDDDSRLAVLTQSVVQDTLWLALAAAKIFATKFSAYFVPGKKRSETDTTYDTYYAAKRHIWPPRLSREGSWYKLAVECWDARLVQNVKGQPPLIPHLQQRVPALILEIRRGKSVMQLPTFPDWNTAIDFKDKDPQSWSTVSLLFDPKLKECERKVNAVCQFAQDAKASHDLAAIDTSAISLERRMELHRALQRGRGFHPSSGIHHSTSTDDVIASMSNNFHIDENQATGPLIPVVNLLDGAKPKYLEALLQKFLEVDRGRIREYLRNRPLGLGVITAGPGFGKTTALAVATLVMRASQGKVYGSAPSNVAVDNFAERLSRIDDEAIKQANKGGALKTTQRIRRIIIIRGYAIADEIAAFRKLLESPKEGNDAAPKKEWKPKSKWKLDLSATYWLLMVLRSPAVRQLDSDDSLALHDIQKFYDGQTDLAPLRDIMEGKKRWEDLDAGVFEPGVISEMLQLLIDNADILLTTPAKSQHLSYLGWKKTARGVAIDEAANMTRPDLDCIWGNVLLPCFLAGDEHQLRPTVKTEKERDRSGKYLNRHHADGIISPLEFFKMNGWPILRLRVQFRMARGQFDICHRELYSDLPFEYAPCCRISTPAHRVGNQLEDYTVRRFPELRPPPQGTLSPIFIHCRGSKRERPKGRYAMSSQNTDQNTAALKFLGGFVKASQTNPARICLITPYKANVHAIEKMRKRSDYDILAGMPPAATVDSFQGREGDIVVAIMVSTEKSGPGFMRCENRLNVLLSRHRSALVIVGDINVAGALFDDSNGTIEVEQSRPSNSGMLSNVCSGLVKDGRVVVVECSK
uniref:DNA2/NAM7 helicase-like C-terminal domain-containing protein n=1 Tax=Bionectria ochroleuca TaxID=29856 RepID=A0A8H7NN41_BIOOC